MRLTQQQQRKNGRMKEREKKEREKVRINLEHRWCIYVTYTQNKYNKNKQ